MRDEVFLGLDALRLFMLALSFMTMGMAFLPSSIGGFQLYKQPPGPRMQLGNARVFVIGLSQFFIQVSGSKLLPIDVTFLLLAIGFVLLAIAIASFVFARRIERWLEARAQTPAAP